MDQLDHLRQQKHKPMFNNIIEPSIVRAQFASNRDASFNSYLKPNHLHHHHQQQQQQRTEDADQISIFDAAEYFKGLHDEQQKEQAVSPRVLDLPSMARLSSVSSSTDPGGNYRARSFHATPTASSEASWNSQTGLLQQANPSGLMGGSMVRNRSPNTNATTTTTRWGWLIPGRKCPCSGKKSVEAKTPRMVDLGRSSSSNGTNYPPSLYSARQNSPKIAPTNGNFGLNLVSKKFDYTSTTNTSTSTSATIAAKNPIGFPCPNSNGGNNSNGFLAFSPNPKVIGPTTATTTTTTTTTTAVSGSGAPTTNGFTFPIMENPPIGVKKMFNVIAPNHLLDPHRDSLEVFQPRSAPRSRRTSYEEETTLSDGSSDLFELESFSTPNFNPNNNIKRIGGPAWRRSLEEETINGGDDEESVAPTECYAPTEVSVDWSVTTAEGFDRASLANFSVSASEVGYAAMRREMDNSRDDTGTGNNYNKRNKGSVSNGNNGGGLLLSCRCEKAVSVGPGPIKCIGTGEGAGPRNLGRHVGGRAKEEGHGAHGHGMASGATTGNNYSNKLGGVGVVVGRSRSNVLPKPFAT